MMFDKNYIGSIHDKIRDTLQCRVPGSYLIGEIRDYLDDQKKPDQQKLKMRLADIQWAIEARLKRMQSV
eukprot:CAMPEP_0185616300 /NCGR_PEP_ID=MMETSP0436-20130131/39164_1 /TAXON_ID=626734 ORGANISM="Favella taraikaensis, Strain Fe Narragansett Bay" /NCGR_SAMPLE_ID=MMETSP0436 /ASSEMBLY_ACC=CAM_ASM_000390 /LENGTH=68 /DNA_ID=CAMNT_0028252873 /DNA_START=151 /DNA_END=357 /DNA_ORIENTATION=-